MEQSWQPVVIGIGATAFIVWAGWVSLTAIRTESKADKSLANDAINEKEISEIAKHWEATAKSLSDKFAELEKTVKEENKQVMAMLHEFLRKELDELKNIARK